MGFPIPIKKQIAAVVVVYNRFDTLEENISSYINQVDRLYIVDNSDLGMSRGPSFFENFNNIEYIPNIGNPGIAHALNVGASRSIIDGYRFLMTLDDDSRAPVNLVSDMQRFISTYPDNCFGLISVSHSLHPSESKFRVVDFTMTSGNLIDLKVYSQIGPFNEDLFIDGVDTEYNLRLIKNGFQNVEISGLNLDHNLGQKKYFYLLGKSISYISHSPSRNYYMTRNTIFIGSKYIKYNPKAVTKLFVILIREIIKVIFFESNKRKRFIFFIKGLNDGISGRLGKLY